VEWETVLRSCDLCRKPVKAEEVWVWEAGFRVCPRCEAQNLRLKGIPGRKEPVGGGAIVVKSKDRLTRRERKRNW
jgi:hypothetical protein